RILAAAHRGANVGRRAVGVAAAAGEAGGRAADVRRAGRGRAGHALAGAVAAAGGGQRGDGAALGQADRPARVELTLPRAVAGAVGAAGGGTRVRALVERVGPHRDVGARPGRGRAQVARLAGRLAAGVAADALLAVAR